MVCRQPIYLQAALFWILVICAVSTQPAFASLAGIGPDTIGIPIDQIRVSGNIKTQERFILKWSGLRPGQILNIDALVLAQQNLRDTGLFREIEFQTERGETGDLSLHIALVERRSWLLLPRINRNAVGDIKAGARLRMYNISGADQTLEFLAQKEDQANGESSDEIRLGYTLPMFSKPYELKWQLNRIIEDRITSGIENVERVNMFSMAVARDWHVDSFRIPLTVETAITFEDRKLDEPYPESVQAREAGRFNSLTLALIFDDVHEERYRRFGSYYSLAMTQGLEVLSSDYRSLLWKIEAIGYKPINRFDNVNYRIVFGLAHDSPFDYPYFGIGGDTNIRGLDEVDERGDARLFANLEYVFASKKNPALRYSIFLDMGNVYEDLKSVDILDLRFTGGVGLRWKIESFVKTDLFLDYGYDFAGETGKVFGGTSLAF